jgi:hypothetical protein
MFLIAQQNFSYADNLNSTEKKFLPNELYSTRDILKESFCTIRGFKKSYLTGLAIQTYTTYGLGICNYEDIKRLTSISIRAQLSQIYQSADLISFDEYTSNPIYHNWIKQERIKLFIN